MALQQQLEIHINNKKVFQKLTIQFLQNIGYYYIVKF